MSLISNSLSKLIRRSTRLQLRNTQRALRDLWYELANETRHGNDLRNYCHGKTGLLLHVGCGEFVQSGWINIDIKPRSGAFYFNTLNCLPIEDNSVSHIHTEHFLKHLEYQDAVIFLSECYRVLEIRGTMRIIVPDAEKYMNAYVDDNKGFFESLINLGGSAQPLPTKGAICNQMFRMGGDHQFAWDFETLGYVSKVIGFRSIERSHINDQVVPNCIDGQDWWRPIESLSVNLVR